MADLRRCIGAVRFGIEAHNTLPEDFPVQPSQKDGLGRMCRVHWNLYTAGLARDAKVRKAGGGAATARPAKEAVAPSRRTAKPEPIRTRRSRKVRDTAPAVTEVSPEASGGKPGLT